VFGCIQTSDVTTKRAVRRLQIRRSLHSVARQGPGLETQQTELRSSHKNYQWKEATIMDQTQSAANLHTMDGQAAPRQKSCDAMKVACDTGTLGEIVAANQKMILDYYGDVQGQARMSFNAACGAADIGFAVLIDSLIYAIRLESVHLPQMPDGITKITPSTLFAWVGVASGTIIEFIAYVSFRLYGQCSRQFSAFHIAWNVPLDIWSPTKSPTRLLLNLTRIRPFMTWCASWPTLQ